AGIRGTCRPRNLRFRGTHPWKRCFCSSRSSRPLARLAEPHAVELAAHPFHVGRVPVEVPAARATPKALLGRTHELGYVRGRLLGGHFDELGVAVDAAPEQPGPGVDVEGDNHLAKLLAEPV